MASDSDVKINPSEEDKSLAEGHKATANDFFKNGDYDHAIEFYSKAIELVGTNAVYYANRSFAYLRTECFGYALNDAAKAIGIDPNYVKAYYRRASANMALGKFKLALKDFETVVKVRPNDKDAKLKLNECQKIVRKIQFERAIAVDDNKSVVDSIDIDGMTIEENYSGPKLLPPPADNITEDMSPGARIGITREFLIELMEHYKSQKVLHRKYAYTILREAKEYFMKQPSLVDIPVPSEQKFTICGDIHGQFYDLMNIFALNGIPSPENPYLFNGDFVDRGSFSVECIFTLFSFKLYYPNHFYMSRGNHESSTMNQMYGFEGEVKAKYTSQMANLFTEVFNWLPLCHLISNRILVMHGGLFSEDNVTLDQLKQISRNRQPPDTGLMCELLWSDPQPQPGRSPSKRGVGVHFGPDVTSNFCNINSLEYIVRSHEVKNDGYEVDHGGKCITVFSAPNYCDTMCNRGAYITISGDDLTPKFTSFKEVPHPNVRPMAYANSLLSFLT